MVFPAIDPIPLPAPIWLLKALHTTTLSLHFVAVQMLLGGLLVASASALLPAHSAKLAGRSIAERLPLVMTYVINFGVPPLLFAQVLYGRALYTSSVLIGAWWIAVIPLLIACYWLIYRLADRLARAQGGWWTGAAASAIALVIARIYSSNMTLMLRPEVWGSMYSASASGISLPTGDPALPLRWAFAVAGGLATAGLWLLWLAGRRIFESMNASRLASAGGMLAAAGAAVQLFAGVGVAAAQPEAVREAIQGSSLYAAVTVLWMAALIGAIALGVLAMIARRANPAVSWAAMAAALLASASTALYRDGIRDLTLLNKGFDVWAQPVATNWPVVAVFLAAFVAGLGAIAWLVSVVARARNVMAKAA